MFCVRIQPALRERSKSNGHPDRFPDAQFWSNRAPDCFTSNSSDSVRRGPLCVLDDEDVERSFGWFQLETELFLNCGE